MSTSPRMEQPSASRPEARSSIYLWMILLALAIVFFSFNQQVPRFADDFCRFVDGFNLRSLINDVAREYMTWTGRFPVMFINFTIFSMGDLGIALFNLTNALVFLICVRTALSYAVADNKQLAVNVVALCFVLFLLWFTPHTFAEVILWKTGAIQYFWGCVLALVAITPVITHIHTNDDNTVTRSPSTVYLAAYLILCFMGGAWLEHLSVAIAAVWALLLVYSAFFQHKRLNRVLLFGLLSWTLGILILLVAPGNYERIAVPGDPIDLFGNIVPVIQRLYSYLHKGLLLIYLLFGTILLLANDDHRQRFINSAIMILVGSFATLAMIAAPPGSFSDRVAFPFEFFMIMATLCLFPNHLFVAGDQYKHHVVALKSLGAILLVAVAIDSASMFQMYKGVYQQEQTRHQIIATAKDMGITGTITLPPLFFMNVSSTIDGPVSIGRYFARDITGDINAWENFCYAEAHQIDSVTLGYE